MNARMARLLTRLYPATWRERYGAEFQDLLQSRPGNLRIFANVICSALSERAVPTQKATEAHLDFSTITKLPSAFMPMAMSLTALALVLSSIGADLIESGHIIRDADEGAIAHLWQLLMAGQLPILIFFAFRWLRRSPRQAIKMLVLQVGALLANFAVVFFAGL
jgi:hypothetical protein